MEGIHMNQLTMTINTGESKIIKSGCLVIHDIYENPDEGGQAPYEIFQKALENNYKIYDRVDTIVCLIKI
jgi:hypothetical protein